MILSLLQQTGQRKERVSYYLPGWCKCYSNRHLRCCKFVLVPAVSRTIRAECETAVIQGQDQNQLKLPILHNRQSLGCRY